MEKIEISHGGRNFPIPPIVKTPGQHSGESEEIFLGFHLRLSESPNSFQHISHVTKIYDLRIIIYLDFNIALIMCRV